MAIPVEFAGALVSGIFHHNKESRAFLAETDTDQ
jgi:hypothetical protein